MWQVATTYPTDCGYQCIFPFQYLDTDEVKTGMKKPSSVACPPPADDDWWTIHVSNACLPASGPYGGVSRTNTDCTTGAFETCFKFENSDDTCWTKSYEAGSENFLQCMPKEAGATAIFANSCGYPCQCQKEFRHTASVAAF